jgi:hypothetical protein
MITHFETHNTGITQQQEKKVETHGENENEVILLAGRDLGKRML